MGWDWIWVSPDGVRYRAVPRTMIMFFAWVQFQCWQPWWRPWLCSSRMKSSLARMSPHLAHSLHAESSRSLFHIWCFVWWFCCFSCYYFSCCLYCWYYPLFKLSPLPCVFQPRVETGNLVKRPDCQDFVVFLFIKKSITFAWSCWLPMYSTNLPGGPLWPKWNLVHLDVDRLHPLLVLQLHVLPQGWADLQMIICWNFFKIIQIVPKSSKFLQIVPKNPDSHLLQGNCFLCLLFKPLLPHWGHLTIFCFIPHCCNVFLYFHILAFLYFCIFVVLPPISTISHWGYLTIFWDWNHVFFQLKQRKRCLFAQLNWLVNR